MAFKMKGFSGFGNSPVKHKSKNKEEYEANHPGEPNKDGHGESGHHEVLGIKKPFNPKHDEDGL